MGADTLIEWADHTFNPWIGCTKVSPACDHCYAETLATGRLGVGWGPHAERRRTKPSTWNLPLRWNRQAEREGRRFRVFCASLADVFDNQASEDWRIELWRLIRATPHLDWLLLTKRPQNITKMVPQAVDFGAKAWGIGPWPNVWLGTTVENQAEADRRIPHLLAVPAAKRFLSCEPLLGPVDLTRARHASGGWDNWLTGDRHRGQAIWSEGRGLDWIIAGGESGPKARPSHPDWFRSLRDQCQAAGVPFLFKQWGEWIGNDQHDAHGRLVCDHWTGSGADGQGGLKWWHGTQVGGTEWSVRLVKKEAGALLDGRKWMEVPA